MVNFVGIVGPHIWNRYAWKSNHHIGHVSEIWNSNPGGARNALFRTKISLSSGLRNFMSPEAYLWMSPAPK